MVVILLLAPSTTNGCDAIEESTTTSSSTTSSSTATTAIPADNYYYYQQDPHGSISPFERDDIPAGVSPTGLPSDRIHSDSFDSRYVSSSSRLHSDSYNDSRVQFDTDWIDKNRAAGSTPVRPKRHKKQQNQQQINPVSPFIKNAIPKPPRQKKNYVRHVTRVNFCDYDSQVEVGDEDGDAEAVTKEEEWITKRKTELTTTRQIETRVKRQVVLEDGKVVEDSGPIVSTNTTEDTEKQETESTERRNLGDPDEVDGPKAIDSDQNDHDKVIIMNTTSGIPVKMQTKSSQPVGMVHTLVARPDGLVREVNEKRVVSREEIKERLETEDVRHLGDFSDEAYVKAVNSGVENLEEVLYSPEHQKQLVPLGPRIVHQSTKTHKTVDTEDTEQKQLAKPDGTLVTEKKKTTEHEEIFDQELPDKDDNSIGSGEKILKHTESSQKYYKQRDEQNVEYVADGKVIAKEMRYAAETEQMEREGPEGPNDWDSLSDRIRKARRNQKTLLQQQREAALLADRKDALTKRPLDFDREEETRKGETIKWLESHFGSESPASSQDGSREDDHDVEIEPTKKTYFNVTIKSNQTSASPTTPSSTTAPIIKPIANGKSLNGIHSNGTPSPKVILPDRDREASVPKTKYFQGISNWSERKESTPKHFASKAFRDELKGTLEKGRLKHVASREDLRYTKPHKDEYVSKEDILHQKSLRQYANGNGDFGSRNDLRYRKDSREDSDDSKTIRAQKEDLGYLSGSRTDLRYRRDSKDELSEIPNGNIRKSNGYLKREDSGYVKDSREDVRSSLLRDVEDEREKYKNSLIQRDDSAYVSSSTYFTDTRPPKTPQMRTPDSGIRSPSPDIYDTDNTLRPTVPQRKRAIEKKLRQQNSYSPPSPPLHNSREEPPPDYSPPPRSRSISPAANMVNHTPNGVQRKSNQRTRFVSESSSISHNNFNNSNNSNYRPAVATQTIQTQTSPPPKQSTKVGQAIGNSIRKLVGKIRSASAERKMKMKTKNNNNSNNNRNRSPSPTNKRMTPPDINGSTYQQYNVIDSHIGGQVNAVPQHAYQHPLNGAIGNRESSVVSSSTTAGRRERDRNRRGSSDLDMIASPKQRYYLGEDPYGGSIFGRENKYDGVRPSHIQHLQHQRARRQGSAGGAGSGDDREQYVQKSVNASTLGRFSKSTNRLGSTPNLDQDYRSAQTLPRKLDRPAHHSSTINVSIVNTVKPPPGQPLQNTGPAKPARTYKQLSRSKSFNVHAMNGTNDPSPIYLEKLTRNNYSSNMYKSNPHLHETGPQLKSPSIVNLISRSQRDLTRIEEDRKYPSYLGEKRYVSNNNIINYTNGNYDKKNVFLKGLQDQAPELYKTLHGEEEVVTARNGYPSHKHLVMKNRERESSLGSRSPIEVNKDTASIIRRGSSSTEDYSESYKITTKSDDPKRPSVTNTVQSYTKKTVPLKDGRGFETIQSSERKSVTTSRYRGEPYSNLKYIEDQKRRGSSAGGGPVVIEVRSNSRK